MRIGEWIAELHTNFGRRALIDRKYVFVPMTDGGVFLGKWDSGGSLKVRRVLTARLLGFTTLESFSEVIGRGVRIILRTERQRRSI
jgi:hypothetical protein